MRQILFLFIISFLVLSACKTVKTAEGVKLRVRSSDYLLKKITQQRNDVEWLTAKAKMKFNDNGSTQRVNVDIRLRKDSVIWMNFKKFGIEGARVLITTDSIYLLNRLERNYIISDFSFIETQFNLPANFSILQDLILGNAFFVTQENIKSDIKDDAYFLLADNIDLRTNAYWLDGQTFDLQKMIFQDFRYNRQVMVEQYGYEPIAPLPAFATNRNIELSSPETGDIGIELDLSKIKINEPANIRFSIPGNYEPLK